MYKRISKEEFEKLFDEAVEEVFSEDEIGETGVIVKSDPIIVHMSRQAYEELKVDIIKQSLETDETNKGSGESL